MTVVAAVADTESAEGMVAVPDADTGPEHAHSSETDTDAEVAVGGQTDAEAKWAFPLSAAERRERQEEKEKILMAEKLEEDARDGIHKAQSKAITALYPRTRNCEACCCAKHESLAQYCEAHQKEYDDMVREVLHKDPQWRKWEAGRKAKEAIWPMTHRCEPCRFSRHRAVALCEAHEAEYEALVRKFLQR